MKKLLALFSLLLLGAGCLPIANKQVEGRWHLAFDLPKDWVMVKPYEADSRAPVNYDVRKEDTSVYLQNTDQKICRTTECPEDTVTIGSGHVFIEATMLDPRRVLPEEAEDIGNGFLKIKLCEDGGPCQANGAGNYQYFYKGEQGNYKFTYYGAASEAERVITSAEEVTKFIEGTQVEVETN